jgi:hypothetical protein
MNSQSKGFSVSQEERTNFYELINSRYREFDVRLSHVERQYEAMNRELHHLRRATFHTRYNTNTIGVGSFARQLMIDEFFHKSAYVSARVSDEEEQDIEKLLDTQLSKQVYKPLTASTAVVSGILAVAFGIVASPILVVPFGFVTLFCSYYYHLMGQKR